MSDKDKTAAAPGVVGRSEYKRFWCPCSVGTPRIPCDGYDKITGRFAPCDDCPIKISAWLKRKKV